MNQEWSGEDLDFLRGATEVPDGAVRELHGRVMGRVDERRRGFWFWVPATVAAALLLGAGLGWRGGGEAESLALQMPRAPEAPAVSRPGRSPGAAVARKPVRGRPEAAPGAPAEVLRIETEDPDVVLYLVGDGGD
jgi:hypothetical protein